jgi:hypothetical protein
MILRTPFVLCRMAAVLIAVNAEGLNSDPNTRVPDPIAHWKLDDEGREFNFDMKVNADKVHGDIGNGTRWIDTKINFYKDDVGSNGQGRPVRAWPGRRSR